MVTEISDEEIKSLTQSIVTRYGLDFTCYEPKSLRRRIIRILNLYNYTSIHELWVRFLRDPTFVQIFMNEVSVGMTSMFRDPVLWQSLTKKIPTSFQFKPEIKVWHAGCSTGEEVYSLGILLHQTRTQFKTKAYATDINLSAIDEAKKGEYHKIKMIENERNFRDVYPADEFAKYYQSKEKSVLMNPDLISHVSFAYHNLITDPFQQGFDIIFCRNVMIYFDSLAKVRLLEQFYNSLNMGGYLIIGFFDTMSFLIDSKKFALHDADAKILMKV